jgi:hypothetical protein
MAGTTNFEQWNPTSANQENDAAYLADTQRTGGAVSGEFPSPTANKLFYQVTTFITALANMLAAKGYSTSDANLAVLQATLANMVTNADLAWLTAGYASSLTANGYIKLPMWMGGLILQWGSKANCPNNGASSTASFPVVFPTACLAAFVNGMTDGNPGDSPVTTTHGWTTSGVSFYVNQAATSITATFFAIGY